MDTSTPPPPPISVIRDYVLRIQTPTPEGVMSYVQAIQCLHDGAVQKLEDKSISKDTWKHLINTVAAIHVAFRVVEAGGMKQEEIVACYEKICDKLSATFPTCD